MLKQIHFGPGKTALNYAEEICDAWPNCSIVWLRGENPHQDLRTFYTEVLSAAGDMKALAEDARVKDRSSQRNGEIWFEIRYDPEHPDAYRHASVAQPLHTDGSYIAEFPNASFMYCLKSAGAGGETIFLGGDDLIRILREDEPALFERLQAVQVPHARSGDRRTFPIVRQVGDEWFFNWNYYCVDTEASPEVQALREAFFQFHQTNPRVREALLEIKLAPGEAVVWKDDRLLHGRNGFTASELGERFLWKCCVDIRTPFNELTSVAAQ